ncbi:hypothetical protein [Tsukamurella sp. PLM1]|uniref:hypothetical protein n=1 Tax=Tsukamurella sp. PLM1 TaxID=2929795 RepID=UPI00205D6431|nr:hypothetical protein [Tsukamurella sp. PLM1]BDH56443.1 hypothetical protein MTP03_13820 [Tsukamurella sp. PLM1]
MTRIGTRTRLGAVTVVALALAVSGCTAKGGDTTCEDYLKMSDGDQREQVTTLYKDKHDGAEPATLIVTALQEQARVYCKTAGNADSTIKEIPIS